MQQRALVEPHAHTATKQLNQRRAAKVPRANEIHCANEPVRVGGRLAVGATTHAFGQTLNATLRWMCMCVWSACLKSTAKERRMQNDNKPRSGEWQMATARTSVSTYMDNSENGKNNNTNCKLNSKRRGVTIVIHKNHNNKETTKR